MLNLAFYHRQGDGSDEVIRPAVLRQAGIRSIMVTDVDVDRISGGESLELENEIGLDYLPTAVLRHEGDVILFQELRSDTFDEDAFGVDIDDAVRYHAPTEVRTHPQ